MRSRPSLRKFAFQQQRTYFSDIVYILSRTNKLVFGNGLLSTERDLHRKQRKMLNPVFSIAHMKRMGKYFLHDAQHKKVLIDFVAI